MPFTNFPYGVTSLGIPQLGAQPISIPTGRSSSRPVGGTVWFVDAGNTGISKDGLSPATAFTTITQALAQAGDGTGDTIFVFPGSYVENVVVSQDYLAIIGAQQAGYARPDVVPATGIALTVNGDGFYASHMRFAATAADGVLQQANGFLYNDCVFDGDGTASKAGIRLLGLAASTHQTASEGVVQNSLIRGCAIGVCFDSAAAPNGVGSTDNNIVANHFYSNTLDIATADSGVGLYSCRLTCIGPDNQFEDKNKTTYIDLTTANGGAASDQTGAINGNYFASDVITAGTTVKMVGTGFTFTGNYYTVGIKDGSGLD